ncbi:MAG: multicopper oxidase family protein [Aquisalimonadaceae bacterium]
MPACGDSLTDEEIAAVLAYIKSTWPAQSAHRDPLMSVEKEETTMPHHDHPGWLTRRAFLACGGLGLALLPVWARALAAPDQAPLRLRPEPTRLSVHPEVPEVQGAWGYNGEIPGPVLSYRQGERLHVTLENGLEQPTTIHWHGIRLPNAMDGVPHVTQAPVRPGERFEYAFDLPDAGTYWYHPHLNGSEQLARGLVGALVVEEPEPYPVDRELLWVLDDWRLTREGRISEHFDDSHDMSHGGRVGNTVTVNGRMPHDLHVRPGERLRLRLINAANARIFSLSFGDLPVHVIALDGQPVAPHEPEGGKLVIGPAMRADLVVDCTGDTGRVMNIRDDFYPGMDFTVMRLAWRGKPVRNASPGAPPPPLPRNPVPEPVLQGAERQEIAFGGGMMGSQGMREMMRMMRQGMAWTVNGKPVHSPGRHDHPPLFTLQRGTTCRIVYRNDTAWHHPIHLHGHHFRVLNRNGSPEPHQPLRDTVLMNPRETVETAFVADNPGDWMLHCHILEHQAGGMTGLIRVRA